MAHAMANASMQNAHRLASKSRAEQWLGRVRYGEAQTAAYVDVQHTLELKGHILPMHLESVLEASELARVDPGPAALA